MVKDYKKIILNLNTKQNDRIQEAFKLENIADEDSIKAMAKCMLTDPSPIVRHEALLALGTLGKKNSFISYKNS